MTELEYTLIARFKCENLCGIDEAGRGPLAGPVFAAAVILPYDMDTLAIRDSKKLSAKKREQLFDFITKNAVAYSITQCDHLCIDELNIHGATMLAMKNAVESLAVMPDFIIVDGNKFPNIDIEGEAIVKGDTSCASIAAASILAKVSRDRHMIEADKLYPIYQFAKHKGYPTALHRHLVVEHGPSQIHRKSFLKKINNWK